MSARQPLSLSSRRQASMGCRSPRDGGSALLRRLRHEACEILTVDREKVDLRRQQAVEKWISEARPQAIFLSAAKVGGILANDTKPADFLAITSSSQQM